VLYIYDQLRSHTIMSLITFIIGLGATVFGGYWAHTSYISQKVAIDKIAAKSDSIKALQKEICLLEEIIVTNDVLFSIRDYPK
jgi:hypothetical protein